MAHAHPLRLGAALLTVMALGGCVADYGGGPPGLVAAPGYVDGGYYGGWAGGGRGDGGVFHHDHIGGGHSPWVGYSGGRGGDGAGHGGGHGGGGGGGGHGR